MGVRVDLGTGVALSCVDRGDPSPFGVVFLPGPTDSWMSYRAVLDRLPLSLRGVAVSLRGHGDSTKPEHGYRVVDIAGDVVPLLDGLGIQRAVLVGHSGSCLTARRVALDHPERVAGLVLEAAPTTLRGDPGLTEFVQSVVAQLDEPVDPGFARSFVLQTSSPDLDPGLVDELAAELAKVPVRAWREMFADLLAYDDRAELGRIVAPTRLIWGDADELVGRDMQDELLRSLPHGALVTYPGAGHCPRWENPDRFAADIAAFAERLRRPPARARP